MFETTVRDGVLQLARPETRWLSTGWNGGFERADAAYNVTVPDGWERTDLDRYIRTRRRQAAFEAAGPTLLTGVDMKHVRGARLDPVVAYATVGLSNPATLPIPDEDEERRQSHEGNMLGKTAETGTVNLLVGTTRALPESAQANLLTVVAEAKTATLLAAAEITGTTTDAIIVGTDESGETARFSGSATPVGAAARACVREAVLASFQARYADSRPPASVSEAEYGVSTEQRATVFDPREQ